MAHAPTLTPEELAGEGLFLEGRGRQLATVLGIAGLVLVGLGLVFSMGAPDGMRRFYFSYLVGFVYIASLSLGGLFFTLLQHLTRAAWSVVVRRIAEVVATNLVWVFVLGLAIYLPIAMGSHDVYFWMNGANGNHMLAHKAAFLNVPFFCARILGYFVFWGWLAMHLLRTSVKQDHSGDAKLTLGLWRLSAPCMLAFALTLTFFMVDMVMSLDPQWFSTMIGVYYFAGCAVSFFSLLALICMLLQRSGRLQRAITLEHYHDLGKLMFAFTFFWGYIAFSQFMLQWYGNLPEEITWFARREQGGFLSPDGGLGWMGLGYIMLFGQILIPFAGLVSRWVKRNKPFLMFWTIWILAIHYVDMYWLIMPEYVRKAPEAVSRGSVPFALVDILCWLGLVLLWAAGVAWRLDQQALVPLKDPLLADSLAFDNVKV